MKADLPIMTKQNHIPVLELRRLLYELKDQRPDICIRFRLIGEMWQQKHNRVIKLTERGAILHDSKQMLTIGDLNNVMQFEIDQSFQNYQPHYHYNVDPILVY